MTYKDLLENAFSFLKEYHGTFTRPDASGNRNGKKLDKISREISFPYDNVVNYGEPNSYDRGSSNAKASHRQLTPKNVSIEQEVIWCTDEIDEAIGTPINFKISGRSSLGSTIPSANKGWANNPIKDWDEEDDDISREGKMISVQLKKDLDFADAKEDDHDIFVVGSEAEFRNGLGKSFRSSRGLLGIPENTSWNLALNLYKDK